AASDGGFGGGGLAVVGEDVEVFELVVDGGEELLGGCDAVAEGVDPGGAGHRASWAVWWGQGTAALLSGSSRQPVSWQAVHACPWMTRRCRSARARAAAWTSASGSLCPLVAA